MSPNLEADVAVDNEEELNESKIFQEEIKALLTEVSNIFQYVQFSFLSFEFFFDPYAGTDLPRCSCRNYKRPTIPKSPLKNYFICIFVG